jgi:hypothetical protein
MNVTINNESYYVPTAWDDLNKEEVLLFCQIPYATAPHQARLLLLSLFIPFDKLELLTAEQLTQLLESVFAFTETNFTTPLIKYFEIKETKYLLPDAEFANLNIAEFAYADNNYQELFGIGNHANQANPAAINKLIATLCRPRRHQVEIEDQKWNGDHRQTFNPHKIPTELFTNELSEAQRLYFLKYYESCKAALYQKYEVIFNQKKPKQNTNKSFKQTVNFGWAGIIFDLAEAGIFGDKDKVAYENLHDICYYLSKKQYEFDAQDV